MKTANLTVRHELIAIRDCLLKGADRHGDALFSLEFRQKTYLSSTPADNIFVYIPNEWLHEKDMRDDSKVFLAGYFCPFCPVAGCIDHAVDRIPDNRGR
jgi:hypothetical protein